MRTIITERTGGPTLADLPPGGSGRVLRVRGDGPAAQRLRELGLAPGTSVVFVRRAPLGDPLCFRFRGTELCLRSEEAASVDIEPPGAAAPP